MTGKLVITLCTLILTSVASAADVRLRSAAVCGSSVVRVADVAEVSASDYRLAQSLAELPLCPAPASGRQRLFTQDDVRKLLELSGVEKKSVTITGSETVTISAGDLQHTGVPAKQPLIASGVRQATFEAPLTTVAPAAKPRTTPINTASQMSSTEESKSTASTPLIEKGRGLTVFARSAGVQITTSGKAIDAGSLGDMIPVELADNKQRVVARVTGPQTVELTTN